MTDATGTGPRLDVRELAGRGVLARVARELSPADLRILRADAFRIVTPVVFQNHTRRLEIARRHFHCARSFQSLRPECLDRFYDDLESVIEYLFRRATMPIANLEGWVTRRLRAATVDGYRRRRSDLLGALQRPRLPRWLVAALGGDPRRQRLALNLLEWVGAGHTAGTESPWPLDVWANRYAVETGDHDGARRAVLDDVAAVLAAMRGRPNWYEKFVERPLSRQQPPVAMREYRDAALSGPGSTVRAAHDELVEAHVRELIKAAIDEIQRRLGRRENMRTVVVEVLTTTFSSGTGAEYLDQYPHADTDLSEALGRRLADPARLDRIVAVVMDLLGVRT